MPSSRGGKNNKSTKPVGADWNDKTKLTFYAATGRIFKNSKEAESYCEKRGMDIHNNVKKQMPSKDTLVDKLVRNGRGEIDAKALKALERELGRRL